MKVLFMIPKDDPPRLEGFGNTFADFISKCLEKKQNHRWSAKELLKHPFIVTSKPNTVLQELLRSSPAAVNNTPHTAATIKEDSRTKTIPGWNFTTKMGKNVAFEDEFEITLPEDRYDAPPPFGYDLMRSIVIPAFSAQPQSPLLSNLIEALNKIAVQDPAVAEAACRKMLEDIFR